MLAYGAVVADALPRQSEHQGIKLGAADRELVGAAGRWPGEAALVQSAGSEPDANAVVDQPRSQILPFFSLRKKTARYLDVGP